MRHKEFLAQVARTVRPGIVTPRMYAFLEAYLQASPPRRFGDQWVVNNFIPPFPSGAFGRFVETVLGGGPGALIHGADIAVTNACPFNCYHCYNAGRTIRDLTAPVWQGIIRNLAALGATTLGITGGEPCLRADLLDLCRALPDDCAGVLSTSGYNFTDTIAAALKGTAVYAVCLSLDSADEHVHDRLRGRRGAFRIALDGLERSLRHGFYTYICTVPTPMLLAPEHFGALVDLADRLGVPEIQVIEPAPAGRLLPGRDADFGPAEFALVRRRMGEVNACGRGPVVTSFAHMESPEAFGCGAGRSHIYIDGTGEVSPCNLLPVSYGNAAEEPLRAIVMRMQERFDAPCAGCLAHGLRDFFGGYVRQGAPVRSAALPPIPRTDGEGRLPVFFQVLSRRDAERAGPAELRAGYDEAAATYDDAWLSVAAAPVDEMFDRFPAIPGGRALDCGCGTGYTTERLLAKVAPAGTVLAVDLSEGMIARARRRLARRAALDRVTFRIAAVADDLRAQPKASLDAITMTWLIGYVSCGEVFPLVRRALGPDGRFGFVAHLDRSPLVPIEAFEAVARDHPDAFEKVVEFTFPRDLDEVHRHLADARLEPLVLSEGTFEFHCRTGMDVYDHLMKSGAGTTYWLAVRPADRERLKHAFVERIEGRFAGRDGIAIEHRYVLGVARPAARGEEAR